MTDQPVAVLQPHRGVLKVGGADRTTFLQGLLSNDVTRVTPERALWAAFLTPQGKFLHDLFLSEREDVLFLEGEAERLGDLHSRLKKYKLRAKVTLDLAEDLTVAVAFGATAAALPLPAEAGAAAPFGDQGTAYVDPRLADAGLRLVLPAAGAAQTLTAAGFQIREQAAYDAHRLRLGLPDGSRDLPIEKAFLMENGFEELAGVDFRKGCYIGQETTARMKHRGLVRKRLMPVTVDGPLPAPGTAITDAEGKTVGEVHSGDADARLALAMLKLDALAAAPFQTGETTLTPFHPDWMRLPESA